MDLYVICRRDAWASPQELEAVGERSSAEGDKAGSGVRWRAGGAARITTTPSRGCASARRSAPAAAT